MWVPNTKVKVQWRLDDQFFIFENKAIVVSVICILEGIKLIGLLRLTRRHMLVAISALACATADLKTRKPWTSKILTFWPRCCLSSTVC
jgi:hypothetical protein